jgi:hypothetical protein
MVAGRTYQYNNRQVNLVMLGKWKGASWVDGYDFPPSLYRRSMLEMFEDPLNPTEEEFLMAIMMEGISGRTKEEVDAIKKAKIRVEGKGNKAYPD